MKMYIVYHKVLQNIGAKAPAPPWLLQIWLCWKKTKWTSFSKRFAKYWGPRPRWPPSHIAFSVLAMYKWQKWTFFIMMLWKILGARAPMPSSPIALTVLTMYKWRKSPYISCFAKYWGPVPCCPTSHTTLNVLAIYIYDKNGHLFYSDLQHIGGQGPVGPIFYCIDFIGNM